MKITLKQPAVNALRALLNQEGYVKDFGDFYVAGKSLSEWPKERYLMAGSTDEDLRRLESATHELEVSDEARRVVKLALSHYVGAKKPPTVNHFEICAALDLKDL